MLFLETNHFTEYVSFKTRAKLTSLYILPMDSSNKNNDTHDPEKSDDEQGSNETNIPDTEHEVYLEIISQELRTFVERYMTISLIEYDKV